MVSDSSGKLEQLIKLRMGVTTLLCCTLMLLLAFNLLLLSSWSDLGAKPVFEGSVVSLCLATIIGSIIFAALIGVGYIIWANRVLDTIVAQAKAECEKERGGL